MEKLKAFKTHRITKDKKLLDVKENSRKPPIDTKRPK
jgi:hypothetical protein